METIFLYQLNHNLIITYYFNWKSYKSNANTQYHGFNFYHLCCGQSPDDCVCCREIKDEEDTMKLQSDIDRLGSWARKWGIRFQPVKCNMMQLTRKRIKKIHASYTLEGTDIENVESIKYLGVTITSALR